MKHLVVLMLLSLLWACSSEQQNKNVSEPFLTPEIVKQVDDLYNSMSLEERVAQICGIRSGQLTSKGKLSLEKCREKIPHGIGHICQFACALDMNPNELRDFVRDLQNYLIHETAAGIPAIFHEEAITGLAAKGATVYPQQLAVACTWNPELARLKTEQTATTMRSVGATMVLSPMVDIILNAHWPRIEESYGEDAYLSGVMGAAFVAGLQKGDLRDGVAACTKHFLGYGGGSSLAWKEIYEEVLFPHEAAIRTIGSKVVMTSYGKFRSKQAVSSDTLLSIILKDYLEYDGLVVSDYGAVGYSSQRGDPNILKMRAAEAMNAGNDIEFPDANCYRYLPELLREGIVEEQRFAEAVKKTLALKLRLGLLYNEPKLYDAGDLNLDPADHRNTSYQLASQSVVMLKNKGILPITGKNKQIALLGPNANTFWCMLGDYTYQSMQAFWWGGKIDPKEPLIISLYEALNNKLGEGFTLHYERGCDWSASDESSVIREGDPRSERLKMMLMESSDPTNRDRAVQLASNSDLIIAALGENPTLSGEARERQGIGLPGDQESFLQELINTGKPVVLVMFGGRPQVISSVEKGCAAILQAWYPGEEGGNAVADILLGHVNPSGKLCVSYPATESRDLYCYNNALNTDSISYPFGYGLSYSSFTYSDIKMPKSATTDDDYIKISCRIKNESQVEGTEIVQLYLAPASSQPIKPIQLKAFSRVNLLPGETKKVIFNISPQQMAYYMNGMWTVDPGIYQIKIGASSADIRLQGSCQLKGKSVTMKHRDILFSRNKI